VQVWVDRLVLRQATIYVIDTGPGIAPPHRAHIFDRFCLVDTARSRGRGGTGQTLGIYGVGPGPYLVLPLLPPLTVRDGMGFAVDTALNPLNYVAPLAANVGSRGTNIVNDRALNLERFEGVEEATLDLYTAVRNAYLQRRQRVIQEGVRQSSWALSGEPGRHAADTSDAREPASP
jgi:ABC-type transporter lipoprotein component MlaA